MAAAWHTQKWPQMGESLLCVKAEFPVGNCCGWPVQKKPRPRFWQRSFGDKKWVKGGVDDGIGNEAKRGMPSDVRVTHGRRETRSFHPVLRGGGNKGNDGSGNIPPGHFLLFSSRPSLLCAAVQWVRINLWPLVLLNNILKLERD
jgi:hypothetical protein